MDENENEKIECEKLRSPHQKINMILGYAIVFTISITVGLLCALAIKFISLP